MTHGHGEEKEEMLLLPLLQRAIRLLPMADKPNPASDSIFQHIHCDIRDPNVHGNYQFGNIVLIAYAAEKTALLRAPFRPVAKLPQPYESEGRAFGAVA